LKRKGFTILLVEQNLNFSMKVLDRLYMMELGQTVDMLDRATAAREIESLKAWLSV
jgi:branched-chain amino acid transport system ATP-binding protein